MIINSNCPITGTKLKKYEEFFERIKTPINKSKLADLYCVLLRTSFELQGNKDSLSSSNLKKFTAELLSKIINEGWAIIDCYERAAFLSSFHHKRSSNDVNII